MNPELTRYAARVMAPLWFSSLRAPAAAAAFDRLGLDATERYFPARAAPLGAASLPLVVATFFNFSPLAVGRAIPGAWAKATPTEILDAQLRGLDVDLQRAFAALDPAVTTEALALLRPVAEAAAARPEGRPLFAAYASLPWPDEPHLALWHAHYLLREFRGDGHIAVLVTEGLTGVQALVIQMAQQPPFKEMIRTSRAWTDDEWDAALDALRSDGWLTADDEPRLTDAGIARREKIECHTDDLDVPAYAVIGDDGCRRVIELGQPIGEALVAAGLSPTLPPLA
jgi:hypothetical protein